MQDENRFVLLGALAPAMARAFRCSPFRAFRCRTILQLIIVE